MEMNYEWIKDPNVYQVNRLAPHASYRYYGSLEEFQEKKSQLIYSLNGYWKFHYCESFQEVIPEFYHLDYDCSRWHDIRVPAHIQLQGYGKPMYVNQVYPWSGCEDIKPGEIPKRNPIGSYVRDFEMSKEMLHYQTRICFHGVESAFALWVNGQFIGYSEDSFTPSTFDISHVVRLGKNKIAVQVYRFSSGSWLEDQDFWRFSGIFRDVEIELIPSIHVEDLSVETKLNEDYTQAQIHLKTVFQHIPNQAQLRVSLYDQELLTTQTITIDHQSTITFQIENPHLWSAEDPHLYQCVIEVIYENQLIEILEQKIGIREFCIKDGCMCINNQRIVFHGVNRHEFSPDKGRVVSYEETLKDILMMKENNINAVRTSHYPNQSFFYDLCDEYGLYVIDEVNLETHGTWSEFFDKDNILPDDKPEWYDIIIDRAQSMFERDKNHPAILIWSLGNESHGGKNLYAMAQYLRQKDSSRLIHYEGISHDRRYNDTSDIESQMYTPAGEVEDYLKKHQDKPFLLCEYAHAMGNSLGALYKYTDLEKKYPLYQGGFIWDFADQALYHNGQLMYGGDYRERPSDYDFCGNGIVFADRRYTPKMAEVKRCYQNIDIVIDENHIQITNHYLFTSLEQLTMHIQLYCEGQLLKEQSQVLKLLPSQTTTINNPYSHLPHDHEYYVTVSFQNHNNQEVAFQQYIYPLNNHHVHHQHNLTITEDYLNIGVIGKDFHAIFSKTKGLVSYQYHQKEMIRVAPRPQFFRAATNNDVENQYGYRYGKWLAASLYAQCRFVKVDKQACQCEIVYEYSLPDLGENPLMVTYSLYGDGEITITMDYQASQDYIEMPTFGMMFQLYSEFNKVDYYGLGPDENYCDRCLGSRLGIYHYDLHDNLTPYLYPQECGNRTQVRYAHIHDQQRGLCFTSQNFEFSALPYTPLELENAKHQYELPPVYQSVVCIYQQQMGVGGDNTWGARTHPEFLLSNAKHYHFTFSLKGIDL